MLKEHTLPDGSKTLVPDRYLRASDFNGKLGQDNNPEWKTVAFDTDGRAVLPNGSIGFRWGAEGRVDQGKWNLENKEARHGAEVKLKLSVHRGRRAGARGGRRRPARTSAASPRRTSSPTRRTARSTSSRCRPCACAWARKASTARRWWPPCSTCRWRSTASTAAWAAARRATTTTRPTRRPGPRASPARRATRSSPWRASSPTTPHKTHGKSMVIIGAAMNHWYHADMNYRGVINLLMMCGCIGQSGGGWAHYVGQEKLRPQTGWTALAFALDWIRPPRQMNSTSFFYAHTDQWRYEKLGMEEIVSPLADKALYAGSMIDYNVRAERMGWLPSAPQLKTNPLQVVKDATAAGLDAKDYVVAALKDGTLQMSCEDPDAPQNWPRMLFVWRSNLLGSSGKGHEYFCKHLLGTENGMQGKDLGKDDAKPTEVKWHEQAPGRQARPGGDARLPHEHHLPVQRHRAAHRQLVREERPQHQRHAPLHPPAVARRWTRCGRARSDWEIYKGFAKTFSEVCVGHLGVEKEVVLTPHHARHRRRTGAALRREGMEEGPVRADPRQDRAADRRGRARLPERLQALHRARPLDGQAGQRRQGHRLEDRHRGRAARPAQRQDADRRRDAGHAEDRDRHRRLRGHPAAGARDQRPRRGEGLGGAGQADRPRPHAPGAVPRGREDPLPRRAGAAAQDHQLARPGAASRARPSATTPATPTCTS